MVRTVRERMVSMGLREPLAGGIRSIMDAYDECDIRDHTGSSVFRLEGVGSPDV